MRTLHATADATAAAPLASTTPFVRPDAIALPAIVAGLMWAAQSLVELRVGFDHHDFGTSGRVIEALFIAALLATATTFLRHLRAAGARSRTRTVADALAGSGFAILALAATGSLIAGRDVLAPVFTLGLLAALLGMAGFLVAEVRRPVVSTLAAPLPLAGFLVGMSLDHQGGGVLIGAAFGAIALLALRRPSVG